MKEDILWAVSDTSCLDRWCCKISDSPCELFTLWLCGYWRELRGDGFFAFDFEWSSVPVVQYRCSIGFDSLSDPTDCDPILPHLHPQQGRSEDHNGQKLC